MYKHKIVFLSLEKKERKKSTSFVKALIKRECLLAYDERADLNYTVSTAIACIVGIA